MDVIETAQQQKAEQVYNSLSLEEKRNLYALIDTPEFKLKQKSIEKLIYKNGVKPPTPEEFLDPKNEWIPPETADDIFPHIRETFLDLLNGEKNYFQAAMYGSVRVGKSYMVSLVIMYMMVFIHHLREPGLYYGLSATTKLAIYLVSFDINFTYAIYIDPILEWLERSPKFHKVRMKNMVKPEQKKYGLDKIIYCTSKGENIVSVITLDSPLQIRIGNKNPRKFVGTNLLALICSEITLFTNENGANEEQIFQIYSDAYSRIKSTMGNKYLALLYLDSSANIVDSKIEKHIINVMQKSEDCCFRWFNQWKCRPELTPTYWKEYDKLREQNNNDENKINKILFNRKFVFRVISGNGQIKARLDPSKEDLKFCPKDLIHYVPSEYKIDFENNLLKSIKDILGVPSSNDAKLIQDQKLITNIFSNKTLVSNDRALIVGSELNPERLIWDKVEHLYWNKTPHGHPIIYRAPTEPRFVAIDHAYSKHGDMASISCCHPEFSIKNDCTMAIFDFILTIKPSSEGINLSAITCFILDLIRVGNLKVSEVASDTFQSEQMQQDLKRMNVETIKRSVDRTIVPYMRTLSAMSTETVKAGYSLFLENNLSCLEMQKKGKDGTGADWVNHPTGSDTGEGKFGKDTSDSYANSTYGLFSSEYKPLTIYEDENKRLSVDEDDIREVIEKTISDMITIKVRTNATRMENSLY